MVHTHTIFTPLISLVHLICQLQKTPYITTPHGMLEPWALSYKAWKKKPYYRIVENPALQRASAIQCLTNLEAKQIESLGFNNTVVVPNGINHREFDIAANPEIFYQEFPQTRNKILILFLARIDPKKGLDLLALAFAKVHQKFPNTHLIIAGPDNINFSPTVEYYFIETGCRNAVTFTGMITGSLKSAALAASTIYIAPSYSEGFSMSILEAMASGLPCVITTKCNFPEAAEVKAAYVVDTKVDDIANRLIQCLDNLKEAKATGDRAKKFIRENYTWDKIAIQMIDVYQKILEGRSLS